MKDWHDVRRAFCWIALLSLGAACLAAQEDGSSGRIGVPQDWSQRQIIFTREGLALHPELMDREPRILHQVMQRWAGSTFFRGEPAAENSPAGSMQRDWNVALGGGRIAPQMFPAKYSFNPGAPPDCTNDFVVFGLNVLGATGGQANLVGLNNLYSGTGGACGAAPTTYFAYNVTTLPQGKVATSPVLSLDGKKIAFVETEASGSAFHVLTWGANQGTILGAATPTMASVPLAAAAGSTRSSPYVDYANDAAYVGADDGFVYKITGVFKGTPALAGSPWPIQIGNAAFPLLSSPVLDISRSTLMVGNGNGRLYSINTKTGVVNSIVIGQFRALEAGVIAPPIVDITNGTTFVVSSNDGAHAVLVEVDTATLTQLAKAQIGIGSASGTDVKLYQPAFDNNYFNNPSTGKVRLCGTGPADATPWQYAFGFSGRTMNPNSVFSKQIVNSTTARCTGWTEFFNPNINGGTDYFFFGLLLACTDGSNGCIVERVSDTQLVVFDVASGSSGVVVDNYSTAAQASNIYLTDQHSPNRAYKLTQNGLN